MYAVSVSNCTNRDGGVFCILIIDIISKSNVVLFTLSCASKHFFENVTCYSLVYLVQNNTGRIIGYFHSTVKIVRVSVWCWFFIFVVWNKWYIMYYFSLIYDDNLTLAMIYIKISCIIYFLPVFGSVVSW